MNDVTVISSMIFIFGGLFLLSIKKEVVAKMSLVLGSAIFMLTLILSCIWDFMRYIL